MGEVAEQAERPIVEAAELRAHFGAVNPLAERKCLPRLDAFARRFIALSPFLVLASSDGAGGADASPRGDAPGFVAVIDDGTLLIPDRRGNNRVDSFGNVLESPGIGLVFLVPGMDETLRVNGRGTITRDPALLAPLVAGDKVPSVGLVVSVEEVFFHCGKALMRARLWDPSRHVDRTAFPTLGRIIAEQTRAIEVAEAERIMEEGYRTRLY